jgi:hypothetical protein
VAKDDLRVPIDGKAKVPSGRVRTEQSTSLSCSDVGHSALSAHSKLIVRDHVGEVHQD